MWQTSRVSTIHVQRSAVPLMPSLRGHDLDFTTAFATTRHTPCMHAHDLKQATGVRQGSVAHSRYPREATDSSGRLALQAARMDCASSERARRCEGHSYSAGYCWAQTTPNATMCCTLQLRVLDTAPCVVSRSDLDSLQLSFSPWPEVSPGLSRAIASCAGLEEARAAGFEGGLCA